MLTTNEETTEGSLDRVDVENDGAPLRRQFLISLALEYCMILRLKS